MDWKFENRKWLYPGIGLKRWIFLLVISFVLISAGIAVLVDYQLISHLENIILDFFSPLIRGDVSYWFDLIVALVLIVSGLLGINYSLKGAFKGIYQLELHDNVVDRLYEKNVLQKGPRVVALGGGTGLSNLLRGLKKYSSNLTAIVTVADDGGSSGKLRDELGMLPPGDIRNCLVALADAEPLMQDLFQHRFESEGPLEGHSFGNLFIASLTEVLGDFEDAVKESSKVLAIRGKVLPATNEDIHLGAVYADKTLKIGESGIPDLDKRIEKVFLNPSTCRPSGEALESIRSADIIVIGPGSLYTSIIPNLLVKEIAYAIKKSDAIKIYVSNVMTQPGETSNYSVSDHIKAIFNHSVEGLFDYVIANKEEGSEELILRYKEEGAYRVLLDEEKIEELGIKVIKQDLLTDQGYIRHNPDKLARIILETARKG
ncbi:MAG: gluconeogenesis factor YvcK family protein [Bacillota bacterium]